MNNDEIFEILERVMPQIITYNAIKSIEHFDEYTVNDLIRVWEDGIVKTRVSRGCSGCIKHVADVAFSYYEREKEQYYAGKEADRIAALLPEPAPEPQPAKMLKGRTPKMKK